MVSAWNICLLLAIWCYCLPGVDSTYKQPTGTSRRLTYYERARQQYYNYYKLKNKLKKRKWPKKKGRCAHSTWKIDGINPVMEEAKRGSAVALLALKPSIIYGKHQLAYLNEMTSYYTKVIGWKIQAIALTHRSEKLPKFLPRMFPHIKFFQEPKKVNIYKKIYANYGHIIIYDKCGRQQYSIAAPYSHTSYQYIRSAMQNTILHYNAKQFCGKCLPYVEPTTQPQRNSTVALNSTVVPTELARKRNRTTPVPRVDGPYTNMPFRRN